MRKEVASGLGTLEETTASIRADVTELSARIESLNQIEGALEETTASIHEDMAELSGRLGSLDKIEGALEETRASIHADITELGARLGSLDKIEGTLEETSVTIDGGLGELSARVSRLGKQLNILPTPQLEIGDMFPELTLESAAAGRVELREHWSDGPLAVAFLRHFGCAFCREHLAQLDQARDQIHAAGGEVVAIFQNRGGEVRDFCHERGVGLECLGDPRREAYDAVGLKKGSWKEYLGPQLVKGWVRAGRSGHLPGVPIGDVAQRPGTFVVASDGRIVYAHYNRDSSDNPKIDAVVAAVREATSACADGAPRLLSPPG